MEMTSFDRRPRVNPALSAFYREKSLADAFADSLVKMSIDQLNNVVIKLQQQIAGVQGSMNYANAQYAINHFGGQTPDQFNNYMSGLASQLATYETQLQTVLAYLGPNSQNINQPIDKTSLVDKYNQPVDESQDPQEYGAGRLSGEVTLSHGGRGFFRDVYGPSAIEVESEERAPLSDNWNGRDPLREMLNAFADERRRARHQELEGFFSSVGKVLKNVAGYALAIPTAGFSLALTTSPLSREIGSFSPFSALLPAGIRQRTFNLTPQQSAMAETIAKVERGIGAAVAVTAGAYAALPAAAPAAGAAAPAAGAAAGGTAGTVTAAASLTGATAQVAKNFFPQSAPSSLDLPAISSPDYTGILSSQRAAENPLSTSSMLTPQGAADSLASQPGVLAQSLSGVWTGVVATKNLGQEILSETMDAMDATKAFFKTRNELVAAFKGPNGITTNTYNAAQIPGASSMKDGYAYPSIGGGAGGGFAPSSTAGDGSSESALLPSGGSPLDLSGIGMGVGGNTGVNAPGVQRQSSQAPLVVGVLAAGLAAYLYYNPKARKKAKKFLGSGIDAVKGKVLSWAS